MEFPHAFFSATCLVEYVLDTHLVRAGLALAPAECAEFAAVHTDVGRIDVHVLDEIHTVSVLLFCHVGCQASEQKDVIGLEKIHPVFSG